MLIVYSGIPIIFSCLGKLQLDGEGRGHWLQAFAVTGTWILREGNNILAAFSIQISFIPSKAIGVEYPRYAI